VLDLDFFGISGVNDESVSTGHLNLGHVHGIDKLLIEKKQILRENVQKPLLSLQM
jgi:hypothetical protein